MTTTQAKASILSFLIDRLAHLTKQPKGEISADTVMIDGGLKSIDAVLLCGEVEDTFGVELDPATIFEHETLGSFAAEVEDRLATS